MSCTDGIELSGWLVKSPPERKLRKNAWKKRWFVLRSGRLTGDPNVLEYYRSQTSKKPKRSISLDQCIQIDTNVPVKYEVKSKRSYFIFDVVTKQRTYYLVADSSFEMASWVARLCKLCGFYHDTSENGVVSPDQKTYRPDPSVLAAASNTSAADTSTLLSPNSHHDCRGSSEGSSSTSGNHGNNHNGACPVVTTSPTSRMSNHDHHQQQQQLIPPNHHGNTAVPNDGCVSASSCIDEADGVGGDDDDDDDDETGKDYVHLCECDSATPLERRGSDNDSVFENSSIMEAVMSVGGRPHPHNHHATRLGSMPNCPPPEPPTTNNAGGANMPVVDEERVLYHNQPNQLDDDDEVFVADNKAITSSCSSGSGWHHHHHQHHQHYTNLQESPPHILPHHHHHHNTYSSSNNKSSGGSPMSLPPNTNVASVSMFPFQPSPPQQQQQQACCNDYVNTADAVTTVYGSKNSNGGVESPTSNTTVLQHNHQGSNSSPCISPNLQQQQTSKQQQQQQMVNCKPPPPLPSSSGGAPACMYSNLSPPAPRLDNLGRPCLPHTSPVVLNRIRRSSSAGQLDPGNLGSNSTGSPLGTMTMMSTSNHHSPTNLSSSSPRRRSMGGGDDAMLLRHHHYHQQHVTTNQRVVPPPRPPKPANSNFSNSDVPPEAIGDRKMTTTSTSSASTPKSKSSLSAFDPRSNSAVSPNSSIGGKLASPLYQQGKMPPPPPVPTSTAAAAPSNGGNYYNNRPSSVDQIDYESVNHYHNQENDMARSYNNIQTGVREARVNPPPIARDKKPVLMMDEPATPFAYDKPHVPKRSVASSSTEPSMSPGSSSNGAGGGMRRQFNLRSPILEPVPPPPQPNNMHGGLNYHQPFYPPQTPSSATSQPSPAIAPLSSNNLNGGVTAVESNYVNPFITQPPTPPNRRPIYQHHNSQDTVEYSEIDAARTKCLNNLTNQRRSENNNRARTMDRNR